MLSFLRTINALADMILYSQSLYLKLLPLLSIFEKELLCREVLPMQQAKSPSFDLVIFGLGRFGRTAVDAFKHKRLFRLGYLSFIVHDKGSGEHLKREGSVIMVPHEYAVQYATQKILKMDALNNESNQRDQEHRSPG